MKTYTILRITCSVIKNVGKHWFDSVCLYFWRSRIFNIAYRETSGLYEPLYMIWRKYKNKLAVYFDIFLSKAVAEFCCCCECNAPYALLMFLSCSLIPRDTNCITILILISRHKTMVLNKPLKCKSSLFPNQIWPHPVIVVVTLIFKIKSIVCM